MQSMEENIIAETFRLRLPEAIYQRLVLVVRYYPEEYHDELLEILQHAFVLKRFVLVLKHLEEYVEQFVIHQDIVARLSEAEKQLGLDLTRTFFYRIRAYTLQLCTPVH